MINMYLNINIIIIFIFFHFIYFVCIYVSKFYFIIIFKIIICKILKITSNIINKEPILYENSSNCLIISYLIVKSKPNLN